MAEVLAPDANGEYVNSVEYRSSEHRRWVQLALLREAVDRAADMNDARIAAVEDALEDND